jgi:transcriptional regulator with XRE-family HTH domain
MEHPHPVDIHVGQRIRQRRSLLGLSQETVAGGLGVSFQQVQKYERGTNRMSASRLFELANLFSVPVAYFFENIAASGATAPLTNGSEGFPPLTKIPDREAAEVMRVYADLTPKVRKSLVRHMRVLAGEELP